MENIPHDPIPLNDSFSDEQLAVVKVTSHDAPWYADYANFIVSKFLPPSFTYQQKKKFFYDLRHYFWDVPHLYKEGVDRVLRRCFRAMAHSGPSGTSRRKELMKLLTFPAPSSCNACPASLMISSLQSSPRCLHSRTETRAS